MHSRACLISIENTTAESFHSPRTKGSVQMFLLFLTELFTELSPVLRTRRSCRQFSFPLLGQKYNMRLKMYFKRESWPGQQGIHFNIKEQTSNLNTQQEKIHLKETSNRFKTPSKIHEDNEFTGHLFPFIIYEGLFNGGVSVLCLPSSTSSFDIRVSTLSEYRKPLIWKLNKALF